VEPRTFSVLSGHESYHFFDDDGIVSGMLFGNQNEMPRFEILKELNPGAVAANPQRPVTGSGYFFVGVVGKLILVLCLFRQTAT